MCSQEDKSEARIFLSFFSPLKITPQKTTTKLKPLKRKSEQITGYGSDQFTHSYSLEDSLLHKAIGRAHAAENPGMVITNHFPFLGESEMVHTK